MAELNLIQTIRRINQKLGKSGWSLAFNEFDHQLPLIEKMFKIKGLDIVLTCSACPGLSQKRNNTKNTQKNSKGLKFKDELFITHLTFFEMC